MINHRGRAVLAAVSSAFICLALGGCAGTSEADFYIDDPEGYVIASVDEIGSNYNAAEGRTQYMQKIDFQEADEVAEHSKAIVKARLKSVESFDYATSDYIFEVLADYLDNAEDEINVYDSVSSFYEIGGVYYLFLDYFDSRLYPHRAYNRIDKEFLVREYLLDDELYYDYRDDEALDLLDVPDLDSYIQSEIVDKGIGASAREAEEVAEEPETLEEAIEQSELILCVTITSLGEPSKYAVYCHYTIDNALYGDIVAEETMSIPMSLDTAVGDRFILLLAQVEAKGSYSPVSDEFGILAYDSEEAAEVLDYFAQ